MKSYTSELHNLRSERGSSVYSFMGYAIIAVCVIVAITVFPGMKFEKKEPPQDANYLSGMGRPRKETIRPGYRLFRQIN